MLTIFSTPKPFRGHEAIIQRNAIKSWTLLHPNCEVILFGDDEGTAEVAKEFGICHKPKVLRNEYGTKLLNYIFEYAQEIAKHDLLCYVNCDIILMSDFINAVKQVYSWRPLFLMAGRRWDVDITEPWDFDQLNWEQHLRSLVLQQGKQRPGSWIDYFVFPRNTYRNIPPFVVGRVCWDNWLIWKARSLRIPVVDASLTVMAVHQNHDYSYHPEGKKGVWQGEEAQRNYMLAGGWTHLYTLDDATHCLTPAGIKRNFSVAYFARRLEMMQRWLIDVTRPVRHKLGIRRLHSSQG